MATCSLFEDYRVGQVLTLSVSPKRNEIRSASTLRARIRQLQNPRALSCCLIVDILDEDSLKNPVFLKLTTGASQSKSRGDHGIDP